MIRLGSLAGYPFEGPRLLGGWTPPATPAVYAIAYKPDPDTRPDRYAVIYVDHADDLSTERFPFQHPRAHCWVRRAGSKWKVYICTYEVPGGGRPHREQITRELTAIYHPRCNLQQYDQSWKDEWIGEYSAPTTGPWPGVTRIKPDHARHPQNVPNESRWPGHAVDLTSGREGLVYRCGANPTASSRRERRVPEAGRAGSGTAACSGLGVTSVTISSAIP